jgi:hypothetical protein
LNVIVGAVEIAAAPVTMPIAASSSVRRSSERVDWPDHPRDLSGMAVLIRVG